MKINCQNIFIYIFLIIPLLWMLGGCSDGVGNGWKSDEDGEVEVKIRLYTKTDDELTRATLGESAPSGPELINSWWVAFVDNNNTVAKIASHSLANPGSMDIINTILPTGTYTAYAFANITRDQIKEKTGLDFSEGETAPSADDIAKANISLQNGTIAEASGQSNLPMTGMLRINATGHITEPFAIEVVRLLGKVEFAFATYTDEPVTVTGIDFGPLQEGPVKMLPDYDRLATPNSEGTAPDIMEGTATAGAEDQETGISYCAFGTTEPSTGSTGLTVSKQATTDISDSKFISAVPFYVRETVVPSATRVEGGDTPDIACYHFALHLNYKGQTFKVHAKVKDLSFINRNDHIQIPVRMRLTTEHELTVDVLPYRAVTLEPDFGLKLGALNLNKQVIRLYTDDKKDPTVSATVNALNEDSKPITQGLTWTLSNVTDSHVCIIKDNKDGSCTVTPLKGKRGRDVLVATIIKNGLEITDECVIEVSDRHLSLNKTFLGLTPQGNGIQHHNGELTLDVVTETSENSILRWEILDANGNKSDLVKVSVKAANMGKINSGEKFPAENAEITVTSGDRTGTAYLHFYYDGPDPENPEKSETYSSYCEIMVQEALLYCYPEETSVIQGQTTTFTTTILPKFSDHIPSVKYRSADRSIATVDENGVVTGVAVGSVNIMVYNDTDFAPDIVSDIVKVNVDPNSLVLMREDGVTNANEIEILSTEEVRIKAMSDGLDITKNVKWSIVEKDLFVKVTGGEVTGQSSSSIGTNTVRATYDYTDKDGKTTTLTASCIVVVSNVRKLIIDEYAHGISLHGEIPLKAHVFPDSRPDDQRQQSITWTSGDESIISIKENAYAQAQNYGKTTITAKTTYGGSELTESMNIEVMKENELEPLQLMIYNAKGELVKEIKTVDKDTTTDNEFEWFRMPKGEDWTARIIINEDTRAVLTDVSWEKYIRYESHRDRIELTPEPDGKTCSIHAKTDSEMGLTSPETSFKWNRNEVIFKCKYKGKEYSRRFCVYAPES